MIETTSPLALVASGFDSCTSILPFHAGDG